MDGMDGWMGWLDGRSDGPAVPLPPTPSHRPDMASKPRAVYGKRAAPPKSAYSFDFESPVKPPRPERGNNAFEFDEEEDEEGPRSRGGKWKPRTPTKRVGRTDAVDAKGRGSDPHYDHVGSSPPKRPRTTKSAAAKYDMFEFSDEDEDDVQAKGRTRAGNSRVGAMKSQALPPAKTSKKRTLLPSQDAPRQPTPERDTEDLDPWELPHSSSAKQFPSQPNSPAKQSRPTNKPTTPKKKQPTLTEKILSSPVKDDYFEITVPAHLLRPPPAPSATSAPPAIPKSPSKSRKLIPKKNDSDDSDEAMDGPVSFSQRSGGASTQTSHSQTSQRSRPRPKDDPFSLLDSPPAAQKRGVAARMKAANGRTVDPLSREPPAASPEPIAIAAKPPSPRKLPRSRLSAPPSATPLDPRDAEMQRAIRSMLAAPAPGKAIVGITKMIGTSVALLGSEVGGGEVPLAPGIGTGTASNPPPPPDTRAANGGNQSSSGSRRTYGRRGGMAGAVPQPAPAASSESGKPTGGGGAGSAFPMDLATVADMGSERRPVVQEEPEDDSDLRSKVATRHELSMSGAARMFVDGVEYLLDGLASYQPMSTRRSSAIELVRKVGTSDDVGKLRAHGFVSRILELLSSETDSILLACAGSIACALLADRRIAELAAAEDDPAALRIGLACLASEIDPLVGASWGGNKSDKAKIRELKQVLASSGAAWSMFGEDPSMRGMAVVVIDSLLAHSRRSDGAASLFTSRGGILLLCNFLVANNPGFYATERALRVLEGATMLNPENQAQAIAVESLLDSIVGIMEKAANAARGPDPVVRGQGMRAGLRGSLAC